MLTEEEYIDNGGVLCPYCKSKDIEAVGPVDLDGSYGVQRVVCSECEKEWSDCYTLTGFIED
jgi:transposase-like protein